MQYLICKISFILITCQFPPDFLGFRGVFLTDLTFVEEGNPDILKGRINFAKYRLVLNVLDNVTKFQT